MVIDRSEIAISLLEIAITLTEMAISLAVMAIPLKEIPIILTELVKEKKSFLPDLQPFKQLIMEHRLSAGN
jgi:hypothetical protein